MTKDQKVLRHSLYAQWWMHSASNGHAATRKIRTGEDNRLLTSDELRDEAMQCAISHIDIIRDILEVPDEEYKG